MYSVIFFLVLSVYCAELLFPPLTAITPSGMVCLFCFFAWFFLSILYDRNYYKQMKIGRACSILFYLLSILMAYLFGNSTIAHRYMSLPLVPFAFIIYNYHKDHGQHKLLSSVIKLCIALATITAIVTTVALFENAYISRSIKSEGELSRNLAARGIGGYSIIYFASICSVLLLHCVLQEKSKKTRNVFALILCIDTLLILKSNYMTAVLICLVEIVVYVTMSMYLNNRKSLVGVLGALMILGVAGYVFINYGNKLAAYLPSRIADTIVLSKKSITQAILDEFFADRWPVMEKSLVSFIKYPLFGLTGAGTIGFENGFLTGFGQHSYILDTLALYGLFVGVYMPAMLMDPFAFKKGNRKYKPLEAACLVGMLLIYLFNNATESIALAIGFIFPFVRDRFCGEER